MKTVIVLTETPNVHITKLPEYELPDALMLEHLSALLTYASETSQEGRSFTLGSRGNDHAHLQHFNWMDVKPDPKPLTCSGFHDVCRTGDKQG